MEYNFKEDLKSIREILGLTQSQIAEKIGVEQITISRNEMGKTTPSDKLLEHVYEFAFKNTEIWLREVADARIVGFQRRIYDISCGLSLESCLIEPEDNDIRDVCYNLKLLHLDIDALNAEEHFSENIVFENGTCRYDVKDLYGEDCSYEVKGKNEAEM